MLSKLVLGTVQLGLNYGINNKFGKPSLDKAFDILNTAYDNGINILDTAEAYGESQEVIGKFHKRYPKKIFNIITKLGADIHVKHEDFFHHLNKNCKILNIDKLYGYMFHNYSSFKNNVSLYDKIITAKHNRIIEKTGISLYTNEEIMDVLFNFNDFDFIQIPFNLLDNELKRKPILIKAREKNIEIYTRSTFLQGLFFKDKSSLPKKIEPLSKYLEIIDEIKSKNTIETEVLALQYVLQKEYIDHVLIGVETNSQLIKNIEICSKPIKIPHHVIDAIDVKENKLLNPSNWI